MKFIPFIFMSISLFAEIRLNDIAMPLKGVEFEEKTKLSWEEFHDKFKGKIFFHVSKDESHENFQYFTDILRIQNWSKPEDMVRVVTVSEDQDVYIEEGKYRSKNLGVRRNNC